MKPVLEFCAADFHYPGDFAIKGLDLTVRSGNFTLVLGPNGAGKTTFFKLALGILKPERGRVLLKGRDAASMPPREIAKIAALVEQEMFYPFPFTVEEVVAMGRYPSAGGAFWDSPEDLSITEWAMDVTGIKGFARRSIQTLSGGEKRRVEIARALCQKPELLFLDEPAAFLDLRQQAELMLLLKKLNQQGLTIVMVSHQPGLVRDAATHAVFMSEGSILERGPAQDLLQPEVIARLFGLPPDSPALS